jgi:hypothetical protein
MDIKTYFDQINKKTIEEFIRDSQEEHLTLEFKTVAGADFSNKDDRRNYARALSGFANSSGGIIVWGVEAKNIRGKDCAYGAKEIMSLSQFVSKLNQLSGELVHPPVEGVLHKKVPVSSDKGFAVSFVPESDIGPHMAMGFEGRHYKRSGASFYPMEHYDIEDMFGRRKKPKLALGTEIKRAGIAGSAPNRQFDGHLFIGIENSGRGLARNIAIEIALNEPYHLGSIWHFTAERSGFTELRRLGSNAPLISLGADKVIHAKSSLRVAICRFKVSEASGPPQDIVINAEIMAEDMPNVKDIKIIKGSELKEKIVPKDK